MSALPREVRKQIAAANAAHEAMYSKKEAKDDDKPALDPQSLIDSINQPADEATPADLGAAAPAEEAAAPAPAGEQPAAPVDAPPADTPPEEHDAEYWKHKYSTLAGKYDAEVPRLNNDIRGLQDQVSSLHQVLSTLKQPEEVPTPAATSTPLTLLKDDEIKEYGADLIDVMKRAAQEVVSPELEKLRAENAQLKQSLGGVTTHAEETARSTMFSSLTSQVPDWETVNVDPEFLSWLRQRDIYSGSSRQELLKQAFDNNDTARVVAFFKGYQNEHAVVAPASDTPAPANDKPPAVDMASLAAPGKPKGGASVPRTQEGKRIWRQAEIAAFYSDVRRGAYKQDREAKDKIEADILAAGPENRIVA